MDAVRLMKRLAAGDSDAVRSLYEEYGRAVFSVCLRALGDRMLAEEAAQQTFLQAWRAAETFDLQGDPGSVALRDCPAGSRRCISPERRHRVDRVDEPEIVALPPSIEGCGRTLVATESLSADWEMTLIATEDLPTPPPSYADGPPLAALEWSSTL